METNREKQLHGGKMMRATGQNKMISYRSFFLVQVFGLTFKNLQHGKAKKNVLPEFSAGLRRVSLFYPACALGHLPAGAGVEA